MNTAKDKFAAILAKKNEDETITAPIQKVVPVKEKVTDNDKPLNVRIHKDLLKRVKVYSAEKEVSLKEITTQALEQYLGGQKQS
jgi:predicted HicB family RNase H-like nuclease